jgi:hypothetical protein
MSASMVALVVKNSFEVFSMYKSSAFFSTRPGSSRVRQRGSLNGALSQGDCQIVCTGMDVKLKESGTGRKLYRAVGSHKNHFGKLNVLEKKAWVVGTMDKAIGQGRHPGLDHSHDVADVFKHLAHHVTALA